MRRKAERTCTTGGRRLRAPLLVAALGALAATGCQSDDFRNQPRPPVPIQLTAVITPEEVTVSPDDVGTGPIIITVSNQDDESHTVSLSGNGVREVVGPINPLDTASIQKTIATEGVYLVTAGSPVATESRPDAARLRVGRGRQSARDEIQLP